MSKLIDKIVDWWNSIDSFDPHHTEYSYKVKIGDCSLEKRENIHYEYRKWLKAKLAELKEEERTDMPYTDMGYIDEYYIYKADAYNEMLAYLEEHPEADNKKDFK